MCAHYRRAILRQYRRRHHHRRMNRMSLKWMRAATMFVIVIVVNVDLVLNDLEAVSVAAFRPYSLDRATIWNTFPRTLTVFYLMWFEEMKKKKFK